MKKFDANVLMEVFEFCKMTLRKIVLFTVQFKKRKTGFLDKSWKQSSIDVLRVMFEEIFTISFKKISKNPN